MYIVRRDNEIVDVLESCSEFYDKIDNYNDRDILIVEYWKLNAGGWYFVYRDTYQVFSRRMIKVE